MRSCRFENLSSSQRSLASVRSLFSDARVTGTVTRKTPSRVAKIVGAAVNETSENRRRKPDFREKLVIFQLFLSAADEFGR